jgi:hypothetical protein
MDPEEGDYTRPFSKLYFVLFPDWFESQSFSAAAISSPLIKGSV